MDVHDVLVVELCDFGDFAIVPQNRKPQSLLFLGSYVNSMSVQKLNAFFQIFVRVMFRYVVYTARMVDNGSDECCARQLARSRHQISFRKLQCYCQEIEGDLHFVQ